MALENVAKTDAGKGLKAYPLTPARPEAIVVACSDPRFQAAFEGFVADLGLARGTFVPFVISGGGWVLLNPSALPGKDFQALKERIDLHCRLSQTIKRLVLIVHEDCKWQEHAAGGGRPHGQAVAAHFRETVRRGLEALAVHLSAPLEMEAYGARFRDEGRGEVVFERVV